jgi:hypothetical protein
LGGIGHGKRVKGNECEEGGVKNKKERGRGGKKGGAAENGKFSSLFQNPQTKFTRWV